MPLRKELDQIIAAGKTKLSAFELRQRLARLEAFVNADLETIEVGLDQLVAVKLMTPKNRRRWMNPKDGWLNMFGPAQTVELWDAVDARMRLFSDPKNALVIDSQGNTATLYTVIVRMVEDTIRGMWLHLILQDMNRAAATIESTTGMKPVRPKRAKKVRPKPTHP